MEFNRNSSRYGYRRRKPQQIWIKKGTTSTTAAESAVPPIPFIPEIIIRDILPRLPIKSLLRFKCISNLWNSIISDPNFALYRSAKAVFTTCGHGGTANPSLCFMNDEAKIEEIQRRRRSEFVDGSCNGLLLVIEGKSISLWNPSTRYIKKVLELSRLTVEGYRVNSGLCFDSSSDDYKVVMGLAHITPSYGGEFVIVASLKEKQWRGVEFPYNVPSIESGPVVNGFLHWKVSVEDRDDPEDDYIHKCLGPQKVVAFDPKRDVFKEIPMPEAKNRDGNLILGLGVLSGCLSMSHWDNESDHFEEGNNIQVFVMKEYGVKESWTCMFMIGVSELLGFESSSPFYTTLKPLLLMRNGEILVSYNSHFFIYNPKEMTLKSCKNIGSCYRDSENVFVESMISPTGCEWNRKRHHISSSSREIIWPNRDY